MAITMQSTHGVRINFVCAHEGVMRRRTGAQAEGTSAGSELPLLTYRIDVLHKLHG
jgi:hypothetical protein